MNDNCYLYEMTTIFGHSPSEQLSVDGSMNVLHTLLRSEEECLACPEYTLITIWPWHISLRPPQIHYGGSLMVLLILILPRRVFDLASLDLHTMGIVVVSYTIKVIKVPISKSDFSFESFRMWKTQRDTLMQWGWPKQPRQILIEICGFFSNLSNESSATTNL